MHKLYIQKCGLIDLDYFNYLKKMKDTDGKISHSKTNRGPLSDREGNNQEFIRLYRYRPRLS